jgi:hypothetical protein
LLASGLVAAYSFDEGSGTTVYDASGQGNNGTVSNATWSTTGKFGGDLTFSGATGSWVTIPRATSLDLQAAMTLEAWVYPTSLSSPDAGWSAAIAKEHRNSSNDTAYALFAAHGTGTAPSTEILVGGTERQASGSSVLPLNTWTFLAATYDNKALKLYIGGNLVTTVTLTNTITRTPDPLRIGGDWAGKMFTGQIDNVRIYNTALSQSQIQSDMNTAVANPAPAVTSETPGPGATGILTNTTVTATFNEALQSSSVNTTNFTLVGPNNSKVSATVSYNTSTNVATLTPSSRLANSTLYTATVSGVLSIVGVPMKSPFSWSFTTGPAPAVTSETPASGATSVAISTTVTATFNEAVQSSTVNTTNFVLKDSNGKAVAATVSYSSSTNTATLTPTAPLAYSMTYSATVSGILDTAGDPMASPFTWSFTTAPQQTSTGDPTKMAPSLGPPPSPGPGVFWVNTESALQNAFNNLQSGNTVVIQPGTYNLSRTLYIGLNSNITNVTIRGSTDNFNDVTLLGAGMDNANYGSVPMGISIYNAQNVTIADLSIGDIYYHEVEIKGDQGANSITMYHLHLFDSGEQFVKVDPPSSGVGTSNSVLEYTLIEYTNGTPKTDHGGGIGYTDAISLHDGQNWLIAHNLIQNMHTPDSNTDLEWNPAVLVWNHSSNVTVDGNTFINTDRAIAFGLLDQTSGYDNQGGIIRNNFIYQAPGLFDPGRRSRSDGQILVWDSPNSEVLFNTIITNNNSINSIQFRWTTTGALSEGNLADAPIRTRDGGTYTESGDYFGATSSMFVNESTGNLHLVVNSQTLQYVIDQVTAIADDPNDWNNNTRPTGSLTNIGADATQPTNSTGLSVALAYVPWREADVAGATTTTADSSLTRRSSVTASGTPSVNKAALLGTRRQTARGGVMVGPLGLTSSRRNPAAQTTQQRTWSPWW